MPLDQRQSIHSLQHRHVESKIIYVTFITETVQRFLRNVNIEWNLNVLFRKTCFAASLPVSPHDNVGVPFRTKLDIEARCKLAFMESEESYMAVRIECKVCIFRFSHLTWTFRQAFHTSHGAFPDPPAGTTHEGISKDFGGASHMEKV